MSLLSPARLDQRLTKEEFAVHGIVCDHALVRRNLQKMRMIFPLWAIPLGGFGPFVDTSLKCRQHFIRPGRIHTLSA